MNKLATLLAFLKSFTPAPYKQEIVRLNHELVRSYSARQEVERQLHKIMYEQQQIRSKMLYKNCKCGIKVP